MPTVTETEIDGYAHCTLPRCQGNTQEKVKAIRRETGRTYREMGGNSPGIESSWITFAFADDEERHCTHCGHVRDISDQPRKTYAAISGHDPMGLLGVPRFNPSKQAEIRAQPVTDPEREALEAQNKALIERLEALEAKLEPAA